MRAFPEASNARPTTFLTALNQVWRCLLFISIGGLASRLLAAQIIFQPETRIESLLLAVAGAIAARVNVSGAWLGLLLVTPSLNAFAHIGIPLGVLPIETVASGLYIAWIVGPRGPFRSNPLQNDKASVALDVLATLVVVSTVRGSFVAAKSEGWVPFFEQPYYGFGSLWFGLSSGLVLLLGIALFRTVSLEDGDRQESESSGTTWVMVSLGWSLVGFACYQLITWIPEPYGTHFGQTGRAWIPTLPGDDIHTFGAMAAAVLAYSVGRALLSGSRRWFWVTAAIVSAFLVFLSWSRAAWLAAIFTALSWGWIAKRRRWVGVFIISIVLLGLAARSIGGHYPHSNHPYGQRLVSLFDVEKLIQTNGDRLELYKRAVRMVSAHPFFGVGIGNYYRLSPQYGSLDAEPQTKFAHNALLQLVSELGLGAGVCCGIFLFVVFFESRPVPGRGCSANHFALWVAAWAFAVTQLTANAVNIFSSQQLIFMFLCLSVYRASRDVNGPSTPPLGVAAESE